MLDDYVELNILLLTPDEIVERLLVLLLVRTLFSCFLFYKVYPIEDWGQIINISCVNQITIQYFQYSLNDVEQCWPVEGISTLISE